MFSKDPQLFPEQLHKFLQRINDSDDQFWGFRKWFNCFVIQGFYSQERNAGCENVTLLVYSKCITQNKTQRMWSRKFVAAACCHFGMKINQPAVFNSPPLPSFLSCRDQLRAGPIERSAVCLSSDKEAAPPPHPHPEKQKEKGEKRSGRVQRGEVAEQQKTLRNRRASQEWQMRRDLTEKREGKRATSDKSMESGGSLVGRRQSYFAKHPMSLHICINTRWHEFLCVLWGFVLLDTFLNVQGEKRVKQS